MSQPKTPPARKAARQAPESLSPSGRRILETRTRRLAEPLREDGLQGDTRGYLLCPVGDNLYGLPLEEVARVSPLERMTRTGLAGDVIGLVAEAGRIRQVLDLTALIGAPPQGDTSQGYLAILAAHEALALRLAERPLAIDAEAADSGRLRVVTPGPFYDKTAAVLSLADLLSGAAPTGA